MDNDGSEILNPRQKPLFPTYKRAMQLALWAPSLIKPDWKTISIYNKINGFFNSFGGP